MTMTDEMYDAFLARHVAEQGKKGGEARGRKYTKEQMGEQIRKGLQDRKNRITPSV
jgi:uncharacterized protein YaiI (UPF0178 family)